MTQEKEKNFFLKKSKLELLSEDMLKNYRQENINHFICFNKINKNIEFANILFFELIPEINLSEKNINSEKYMINSRRIFNRIKKEEINTKNIEDKIIENIKKKNIVLFVI